MLSPLHFRDMAARLAVRLILLTAVFAIGLAFFWNYISDRAHSLEEQRLLLAAFEEERLNASHLKDDYARISPFLSTIENALPTEESLYRVVEALENIAEQNGLKVAISLEGQSVQPTGVSGVNYIGFRGVLDGNLEGLRKYLSAIDASPVFASVHAISLTGSNVFYQNGTLTIRGKIYTK